MSDFAELFYSAAIVKWFSSRVPDVEKLKRKGNVEGLLRALSYEDVVTDRSGEEVDLGAPVRARAAAALADTDGPSARQGLLRTLDDPEESVRLVGVRKLKERGDAATADALVEAAATWTAPTQRAAREEAVEALASFRDPGLAQRLVAALLRRRAELLEEDGQALRHLVAAGGGPTAGEATVSYLMDVLASDSDDATLSRAGTVLEWLSPHSIEPLIAALSRPDQQRRAATALGGIRDSRAVEPLAAILDSDDPAIRQTAAWALGEIKDPSAVEALLRATTDDDYSVRSVAAAGLDQLGTVAVILGVTAFMRPLLATAPTPAVPSTEDLPPPPDHELEPRPVAAEGLRVSRTGGVLRKLLEWDGNR